MTGGPSADQQAFGRAASAALLGLGAQLLFAIVMAGMGLYAQSSALHAAAWHLFGGVPIWLTLWLLYQQHRQERAEALEAEQLAAADARAAALFDEAGHNLATARKRLESFYRWGLNAVSIFVAVYLLAAGLALFLGHWALIDQTDEGRNFQRLLEANLGNAATNPWMLVGLSALMAFLGFLVARYVAGMTRVPAWSLLRGGAAYLIGNVLVILLVLVAVLFMAGGNLAVLTALSLLIPLLMVALGIETLLAFVFGVYRPRRAHEIVRPAFDSRLLGWLTRPESLGKIVSETLNYQFGFEITKSWFYVLLGRAITPLILAGALILLGLSCLVIVAPHQQAVVTHSGAFVRVAEPGVSWKLPWPLGMAQKYDVGASQQLVIGAYRNADRIDGAATLWTNEHVAGEVEYFVTAPTRIDDPSLQERVERELEGAEALSPDVAGDGLTDEVSTDELSIEEATDAPAASAEDDVVVARGSPLGGLIALQAVVTWSIGDLQTYVGADEAGLSSESPAADRPVALLTATAQKLLNAMIAGRQVDDLLGTGRIAAADEMLRKLRDRMAPYGIAVRDVLLYDVHPPKDSEVAAAFLDQVNALQSQQTELENAQRDAIGTLAAAAGSRGEALRIEAAIRELNQMRSQNRDGDDADGETQEQVLEQQALINRLIDQAGGEAARTLADARQSRWRIALDEKAQGDRFAFELAAYERAPQYFQARYYLEAVADAFAQANRRVITTVPMDSDSSIRLNLEDAGSSADLFAPSE